MSIQFTRLVVRDLEDRGAAHGGLGRGDQGEVLACDPEQYLPVIIKHITDTSA